MDAIIIAGCGGGYDIFGGLELYHRSKQEGKQVILVNYSFTSQKLLEASSDKFSPYLYKVSTDSYKHATTHEYEYQYFPEANLAKAINEPIYAITNDPSTQNLIECYNLILKESPNTSTIYLVDGGCDVLLTGKETGLGTPVEDMMHLKAIASLNILNKYIIAIGVNVDTAHGVIPEELDSRLETLEKSGVLLSKTLWNLDNKSVAYYREVVNKCKPTNSIVQSLVIAALEGYRGFYTPTHLKSRIDKSKISLSEQTCTLYMFDLIKIAKDVDYMNLINLDMRTDKVDEIIEAYQTNRHKSLCR